MAISLERVCPKEESSHLRGTGLTAPHFCQSSRAAWVLSEVPPNVLQTLSQIVGPETGLAQSTQLGQSAGTRER